MLFLKNGKDRTVLDLIKEHKVAAIFASYLDKISRKDLSRPEFKKCLSAANFLAYAFLCR